MVARIRNPGFKVIIRIEVVEAHDPDTVVPLKPVTVETANNLDEVVRSAELFARLRKVAGEKVGEGVHIAARTFRKYHDAANHKTPRPDAKARAKAALAKMTPYHEGR